MPDAYPELAVDPTDEEFARDWTLSAADLEEVKRSRGPEHRHRFAVQLCALRALRRPTASSISCTAEPSTSR